MGLSLRIFFIDDDDSVHRVSLARYKRLINRALMERLSEFAGRRVRCASIFLEVADGKPAAVTHIEYSIISFDDSGQISADRTEKEMQLAANLLSSSIEEQQPARIIDARRYFLKRQYEHEFKWVPSRDLERAIIEAVFR